MGFAALALIAAAIVATSFFSGVFGMAGGMILLGLLLYHFDVATGMIVFSVIQFAGNAWRVVLWWQFVRWRIFVFYLLGALMAFAVMRTIAFVPDKAMVYLGLGLIPFAIELLPAAARPSIEWRGVAFITGVFTTIIQFLAGVGGLFLDIFFHRSMLDRRTTVVTKGATQSFGHVLRLLYYGSLGGAGTDVVPLWAYLPAVLLAILGTQLAPFVLDRLTDVSFRVWTRRIILVVAGIYLIRGAWLMWNG